MLTALSSALLGALLACSGDAPIETEPPPQAKAAPPPKLDVRATCPQAAWLARTVGGTRVTVTDILPAGEDPPHWRPAPEVIAGLAEADLIVANGAGFEGWMATATLPDGKVVHTAEGVESLIALAETSHSHGGEDEHSHTGTDPHTWGDPLTFLTQARVLRDALNDVDEAHKDFYNDRLPIVEGDLRALDEAYAAMLAGAKGRAMAANHPSFNYLARRYELTIESFDFDPSAAPGAAQLAAFNRWAAGAGPAPLLLWESEPSEAAVAAFPATVKHVYIDPLEAASPDSSGRYDYLRQATANINRFKKALAE